MQFLARFLPPFFISWLFAFTLASLWHSQYVVNQLVEVGVVVAFSDRLSMTIDDWIGLLPTYGSIIAISFVLAFLVAGWISKKAVQQRTALFAIAGVVAFFTVLTAIESLMNIHVIAGARGWGLYAQLVSGGIGGLLFARLSNRETARSL